MQRELSPTKARGGVVSGRVFLVLLASLVGGIVAVALCWAFLLTPR